MIAVMPDKTDCLTGTRIKDRYSGEASSKLEMLQQRINDEDYLHAAIQRLALVLSNEIMGTSKKNF